MGNNYILRKDVSSLFDLVDGSSALGLGVGNIYYVVQTTNTAPRAYALATLQKTYKDGSRAVHSTIQSALDATVANRNDYVIVFPDASDYDITAALTMSKKAVHLICPAGLCGDDFPTNAARIHQNTASTDFFTVTGDAIEIAGFFFKQDSASRDDIIYLSGTRWHPVIHHNFFGMSATASTSKYGIYGDGAVSHFSIYKNYFTNYSPGAVSGTNNDIAAFIGLTAAGSTRGSIKDNTFVSGVNTTVAAGISVAGSGIIVRNNHLHQNAAFGGSDAGAFTAGISVSGDVALVRNTFTGFNEAACITGATADANCTLNYDGYNGGTVVDQDTADH